MKKCWYARATENARKLAESLQDEKAEQVTATAENCKQILANQTKTKIKRY